MDLTRQKLLYSGVFILTWPLNAPLTFGCTMARFIKAAFDYEGSFMDYVMAVWYGSIIFFKYQMFSSFRFVANMLKCTTEEELNELIDKVYDATYRFYVGDED